MCNTIDILKLLNISLPSLSINDTFNWLITPFTIFLFFILNAIWFKVNDITKRYVYIEVPSIQYVTWLAIEYVVSG